MKKKLFLLLGGILFCGAIALPSQGEAGLSIQPSLSFHQTYSRPMPERRIVHRQYHPPVVHQRYVAPHIIERVYVPESIECYEEVYVPPPRPITKQFGFGFNFRFW